MYTLTFVNNTTGEIIECETEYPSASKAVQGLKSTLAELLEDGDLTGNMSLSVTISLNEQVITNMKDFEAGKYRLL